MKPISDSPQRSHLRRLANLMVRHRVHHRVAALAAGVGASMSLTFSPQPPFDGPADMHLTSAQSQIVQQGIQPNVLTVEQARRVPLAVAHLNSHDFVELQALLNDADSNLERNYIVKQVAYGSPMTDVVQLANEIRGQSDDWLWSNMVLFDERVATYGNDPSGVAQQWSNLCIVAAYMTLRGDGSPLYSLYFHQGGPVNIGDDKNQRLVDEQRRIAIQSLTTLGTPGDKDDGGITVGEATRQFNSIAKSEGTPTYVFHAIDPHDPRQVQAAINQIEHYLDEGYRVPLLTSDQSGILAPALAASHQTIAFQHDRNFIEVQSNQYGGWVTEGQIRNGDLGHYLGGGGGLLGHYLIGYYVPNGPPAQPQATILPSAVFPERQRIHHHDGSSNLITSTP